MTRKNLGHEVYSVWANGSQEYGQNHSRGNVYFKGDTIYSYGSHFPMGVRQASCFVLNADGYSSTTRGHQASVRTVANLTGKPNILIPFSSLRSAGIHPHDIRIVDVEPDREVYVGEHAGRDGEVRSVYHHLMGRSVFRIGRHYYLSGLDETARDLWHGFFLAQLPRKVTSVADALESLKPPAVLMAEEVGIDVKRQGEFYFIPASIQSLRGAVRRTWHHGSSQDFATNYLPHARPGRQERHFATTLRVKDGTLYVKGTVRHNAKEHKMLTLGSEWHTVYENTEVRSFSGAGRID